MYKYDYSMFKKVLLFEQSASVLSDMHYFFSRQKRHTKLCALAMFLHVRFTTFTSLALVA